MSYCSKTDVNTLFGDISDEISDAMFSTVIANSDAWIDANLKRNYLPIPTTVPSALKTAAIYYSASDILLALYHGDELPTSYDIWFQKAQSLLDDYIESEIANGSDDGDVDAVELQMVKHSHGQTYSEKRNRTGGVRGWVR